MTTTSETLDLAADAIQERGWTFGGGWNRDDGYPLCLEGGIMAAMNLTVQFINDESGAVKLFTACPAYVAVQEYLSMSPKQSLWAWNDEYSALELGSNPNGTPTVRGTPVRTQEEVIEVLRAAAAVERAKEESLENAQVPA